MSNWLSPIKGDKYRYTRLIGTGGIGSGLVFNLMEIIHWDAMKVAVENLCRIKIIANFILLLTM